MYKRAELDFRQNIFDLLSVNRNERYLVRQKMYSSGEKTIVSQNTRGLGARLLEKNINLPRAQLGIRKALEILGSIFINCFTPYDNPPRIASNFYTTTQLLKS